MSSNWKKMPFTYAVKDETKGNIKTLQSDFLSSGQYPIVDQGKELIAGYTNDEGRLCKSELPVIIFGDHTKCFKFIDFSFCLGADGTKVLRPKIDIDERYLFYAMQRIHIPEAGYSRHFKYLKQGEIPLPPLDEQKRIAAILDQADKLRRLRQTAITKLNTLGQSIFCEMFGAFHDDSGDWPVHRLETLVTDAQIGAVRAAKEMGDDKPFEYVRMDSIGMAGGLSFEGLKRVDASEADRRKYGLLVGDFLFNTRNSKELVGKTAVVRTPFDGIYNNNILRLRFSDTMTADFLDAFLRTRKGQTVLSAIKSGTTSVFAIYQKSFTALDVPVPPKDLQLQYSERLRELFVVQKKNARAYMHASSLLASLQHRAFRGEL